MSQIAIRFGIKKFDGPSKNNQPNFFKIFTIFLYPKNLVHYKNAQKQIFSFAQSENSHKFSLSFHISISQDFLLSSIFNNIRTKNSS